MDNNTKTFLKTQDTIDGVTVVNICHLMDHLYGGDIWLSVDYEAQAEDVRGWSLQNDATYYGRSRESFFVREAVDLALFKNKTIVVVEDFS